MSRDDDVGNVRGRANGFAACALLASLAGCASAPKPEAEAAGESRLAARLDALEQRLAEREQLISQLESRLSLLEAEGRQLRYALAEREASPLGLDENARAKAATPAREPRESVTSKKEARPVLRLYDSPVHAASTLEEVPVVHEKLAVAPVPQSLGLDSPAPSEAAFDLYVAAIDALRQRDFGAALRELARFVDTHPDDPRVGRALFWRGEALFAQKRYAAALRAFESSLAREPDGEKAPDCLLKMSLCHKRLGAHERARAAMERLKNQFPQSDAARLAQAEEA